MSPAPRSSQRPSGGADWRDVPLAPVVLLFGPEDFIASRALDSVRGKLRSQDPATELTSLDASQYTAGQLGLVASPSLFSEPKLIEVSGLATMNDDFLQDALAYLLDPAPDVTLVLIHNGGTRGKKLLDALKALGVPRIECLPLKKDAEKTQFVSAEFTLNKRRIDAQAIRALVAAVGANLSELAAACSQLIADTTGMVSADDVDKYYGGRVEATAFRVADAALAGNGPVALSTLRHALATGVDPVPLVGALAMKVRQIAKVFSLRGSSAQLARDLGMSPWQVDAARRDAGHWSGPALVTAIKVLAETDAQVKGEAKDPVYAVERAVIVIATAARR
ncbi:DNA polymerase III subunit delta [Arthrobacter psychrochitiniphilus]|uniref:DNA-directed DNA polymerase n=1 Tax=Arthrobacter psychrochitiniphilus TaxID=291045 RepID=A0A2V3DQK3_9MICC|nr:DNA polymerase III subunit delta [Arthrobacter psychrochitiniphilus]PXA65263.1 DNA polymerase III subunit delta [Arthrobacter psychrochitiniphilus]